MSIGHNHGPSLDDGDDIKLHYARIHVSDLLNGVRTLSMEERGFYMCAFFNMYDRMGSLPSDDRQAAMVIGCEVRMYRRLKARMIELQKLKVDEQGRLSNDRVEREITTYCQEVRRRRDAALEREEKRRQEARVADEMRPTSPELRPNFAGTSPEVRAEVAETSPGSSGEVRQQVSRKPNKNNETPTTTEPQSYLEVWSHTRASLKPKHKLEEESKGSSRPPPHTTRMPRTAEPDRPAEDVWVCRPGEEEIQPGLFVNCDTIRHRGFTVSIASVAMQLATANLGLSRNEATPLARDASIAHALQWAAEIEAGRRVDIPKHPANFIKGSVIAQRNREAAHQNAMAKPAPVWRGSGPPKSTRNGSYRPTPSELAAAVEELEGRANPAVIDGQFERINR